MTSATEFFRQSPLFTITGGMDADVLVEMEKVASTTLNGKISDLIRLGPYDLTGWTGLVGELRTFDGLNSVRAIIALDGDGDEGAFRIRVFARDTWLLQLVGARAGQLTVGASPPGGGRYTIAPMIWNLEVGSTSPAIV